MGIFSRLSDIINSNLNAVLEKAEDPEKIIRLMIQEMEDTLVELRSEAAKCIADKKERSRFLQRLEQEQLDWERKAELALDKNREDLARAALHEKAHISAKIDGVGHELQHLDEQLTRFNDDISRLQAKLSDAKARQRTLIMRHRHAGTQLRARQQVHSDKIDDILVKFESAERRIENIEAESESLELGRGRSSVANELDELANEDQVNDELARLKAKRGNAESTKGGE
ncbi:MAG: phage shock protein PspA [Wenzhouxiangellaceae bacterium]